MKAGCESRVVESPGECPKLSPNYGYARVIEDVWRESDLIECLILIGLTLMFAYTAFITVRFFCRYFLARRQFFVSFADSAPASEQIKKNLVASLSRGVENLKSIAWAAPFLGLAGTSYGVLEGFYRLGYEKYGGVGSIVADIGIALVATAAGLTVAILAALSHNILRISLEKFENSPNTLMETAPRSYGFAQTLPLRRRFSGFPAFALIGAPVLALLIPMFALMLRSPISMGLPVHLLKMGATDHDSTAIVISVIGTSFVDPRLDGQSPVLVNSKATKWNELGNTLRDQLEIHPHWIVYVTAEDGAPWLHVAYAIDVARGLRAEVGLLTEMPGITSNRKPKGKRGHRI